MYNVVLTPDKVLVYDYLLLLDTVTTHVLLHFVLTKDFTLLNPKIPLKDNKH